MGNPKIIEVLVIETLDWSAEELAQDINQIQNKYEGKMHLTGAVMESEGTEYQMFLFSQKPLTEQEIEKEINLIKYKN